MLWRRWTWRFLQVLLWHLSKCSFPWANGIWCLQEIYKATKVRSTYPAEPTCKEIIWFNAGWSHQGRSRLNLWETIYGWEIQTTQKIWMRDSIKVKIRFWFRKGLTKLRRWLGRWLQSDDLRRLRQLLPKSNGVLN